MNRVLDVVGSRTIGFATLKLINGLTLSAQLHDAVANIYDVGKAHFLKA